MQQWSKRVCGSHQKHIIYCKQNQIGFGIVDRKRAFEINGNFHTLILILLLFNNN